MSNDKTQHRGQPLFAWIFNKTEPGEKGPSTGSDHGVNLEPAKVKAEQWFAAQLSGKEMVTRKRGKEWLEDRWRGRGERHCCSFLRLLPTGALPSHYVGLFCFGLWGC